ncbi:hypothetical protein [Corynebacterium senegalense]|uniref:hypothetical protein n=1 Tax=Corynebacterium senegalense TaxID=2080750 RepID=UPI001FE71AAB|nr:hypothetical protein [Corynebacterium senegalense]
MSSIARATHGGADWIAAITSKSAAGRGTARGTATIGSDSAACSSWPCSSAHHLKKLRSDALTPRRVVGAQSWPASHLTRSRRLT